MIIKKGESSRPKCIHNGKMANIWGFFCFLGKNIWGFFCFLGKNIWGFFLYFSKNIWGFFCFLTKKIWGFRINIVNLHPINRIDYGKSF